MSADQRALFDAERTTRTVCTHCGAIRLPEQTKVPTCRVDLERATQGFTTLRPKACLNAHNPATAGIPY